MGGFSVLEPKWHDFVAVQPLRCDKYGFLFIWLEHRNLMVSEKCIYERKHLVSGSGVDNLIYLRQRETILWVNVVQIGVINTDSSLSSIFWNNHYIRQPIQIFHFLINLAANNLSTSYWTIFCLSGWKRQTFWRMGLEEGITLSRYEVTNGWIPGILEWVHAKTSLFWWNTSSSIFNSFDVRRELV